MDHDQLDQRFIPTGVPGLDHVLLGGLLRDSFFLVQGEPGSGKTTLALQYLRSRARFGERCLYISLTESLRDLENSSRSHGWTLDGIDMCDLTRSGSNLTGQSEASVFHPSEIELGEMTKAILNAVEEYRPQHVVLDGVSEMRLLSGEPLIFRRQLLAFKDQMVQRQITAILLDDRSSPFGLVAPESLVGGNLVLESSLPHYGRARRRLCLTKVRGARFREGYHDYEILQGGIVVYPRLVAAEHHSDFTREVCSSGIPNLDQMLCGVLTAGSTTLMLGPAGVGKSTIAMLFAASQLQQGKKAAVYIFDEVIDSLIDRVEQLRVGQADDVRSYIDNDQLHIQQIDTAELSPGAFAHEVRRAVDDGARVIIIDSLNGYLNAMPEERFLTTHLHELFSYLNQKGVITIMVVAQHGMIAGGGYPGELDVSYLADTVLLFRYFESRGEILQAVSVFKKRTGAHERTLRELKISVSGIEVGEPLRGFRGIMTGVPQQDDDPTDSAGAAHLNFQTGKGSRT